MKRLLPAYPLFVKDPFFSIWSPCDEPNGGDTIFWNGSVKRTIGTVTAAGRKYSFLGAAEDADKLRCVDVRLTVFSTEFDFECDEFFLSVRFISALPPDDLDMLSNPVCYLDYKLTPKIDLGRTVISLALGREHCYDEKKVPQPSAEDIIGGAVARGSKKTAWMGLRKQEFLSHANDSCCADWGYFSTEGQEVKFDEFGISAWNTHLIKSGAAESGKILVCFYDVVSVNYFGDFLNGYFFRESRTIFDALDYAAEKFDDVLEADKLYTDSIAKDASRYGSAYKTLLFAALRQSVGAHKLVEGRSGETLFLSKECHSNGCMATVDVSYPSMPLYLLYNPALVKGMLLPVLKFAKMPVWEYDFAPHDAGCYPHCTGQVYGMNGTEIVGANVFPHGTPQGTFYPIYQYPAGNNLYKLQDQMMVEECGNMLIMSYLYFKYSGKSDIEFLEENYALFESWVKYLTKHGFTPEHQLCTDDFAGRMGKNVNLSIKASCAIAAFALIASALKKVDAAKTMMKKASDHAGKLVKLYESAPYTPLTLSSEAGDTFSLKYNLAADILMETNLYPQEFLDREIECYLSKNNAFGVPLDSRKDYTKSDWILWAASLTLHPSKAAQLIAPVAKFLEHTPDRVPFSDWYDTLSAKQCGFQNRTVQGGLFILLLKDSKNK